MSLSPPSGPEESDASHLGDTTQNDEDRPTPLPSDPGHEPELEAYTSNAEIRTRITTYEPPADTERAELKVHIRDNVSGSVGVPGRFTKLLTDATIFGGGVAGMVWAPSVTIKAIESASSTLPWWATLTIVGAQLIGIGVATTKALRQR